MGLRVNNKGSGLAQSSLEKYPIGTGGSSSTGVTLTFTPTTVVANSTIGWRFAGTLNTTITSGVITSIAGLNASSVYLVPSGQTASVYISPPVMGATGYSYAVGDTVVFPTWTATVASVNTYGGVTALIPTVLPPAPVTSNTAPTSTTGIGFGMTATFPAGPTNETLQFIAQAQNSSTNETVQELITITVGTGVITNTTPPSILGNVIEGQTISGTYGSWSSVPTSNAIGWYLNGSNTPASISPNYVVPLGSAGQSLAFGVTAFNSAKVGNLALSGSQTIIASSLVNCNLTGYSCTVRAATGYALAHIKDGQYDSTWSITDGSGNFTLSGKTIKAARNLSAVTITGSYTAITFTITETNARLATSYNTTITMNVYPLPTVSASNITFTTTIGQTAPTAPGNTLDMTRFMGSAAFYDDFTSSITPWNKFTNPTGKYVANYIDGSIRRAQIFSGGSGNAVNDVLTFAGGWTYKVLAVNSGAITDGQILTPPSGPINTPIKPTSTTGSGTNVLLYVPTGNGQTYFSGELENYDQSLSTITVVDSTLKIMCTPTPQANLSLENNQSWTSSMISSEPSFWQQYGLWRAWIDYDAGGGFWPAFWMRPISSTGETLNWEPPEIDINEGRGSNPTQYNQTFHFGPSGQFLNTAGTKQTVTGGANGCYHEVAAVLSPAYTDHNSVSHLATVEMYIDGVCNMSMPLPTYYDTYWYFILNFAIGGGFDAVAPNYTAINPNSTTPVNGQFRCDWVEVRALIN